MLSDSLPYFLQLIHKNIILHTLITSGSFASIDLKKVEHEVISRNAIEFSNFILSKDDTFEQVSFYTLKGFSGKSNETTIVLSFTTQNSKYFDSSKFYFNDDDNKAIYQHPQIKERRKTNKNFGFFNIFGIKITPANVSIIRNPMYGYMVTLMFYPNFNERIRNENKMCDTLKNLPFHQ